jgi:hemerythrin-like domain-containing protein
MSNALGDLHKDHVNFSRLLKVLSEKTTALKEDRIPNYDLMRDVLDYLENYADLYHHPKENLIYSFHLKRSTSGKETFEQLMQEHVELKQLTVQLYRAVDGLLHGEILPKEKFIEQLSEFVARQRQHLDTEESEIFPLLEKSLTADDWKQIEKTMPKQTDPLFDKVERQYEALYERAL